VTGESVGYVVVCWNQASYQPEALDDAIYSDIQEAHGTADAERASTARVGRKERYAVAEVVLCEDPS